MTMNFIIICIATLWCFTLASETYHLPNVIHEESNMNLSHLMEHPRSQRPDLLVHALAIIQNLEQSPSCNRMAALALINSCQSLERPSDEETDASSSPEIQLDEVKSEYAAKLAMCELSDAKATLPKDCLALLPSSSHCKGSRKKALLAAMGSRDSRKPCYKQISATELNTCLMSMESRPQWWISYSNARQNAMIICQASRDGLDKDKKLEMYESLTQVALEINTVLSESVKGAKRSLEEYHSFVKYIRDFQEETIRKLDHEQKKSLHAIETLTIKHKEATDETRMRMNDAWQELESRMSALEKSINSSGEGLVLYRNDMENIFQQAFDQADSLSLAWRKGRLSAIELEKSLEIIRITQLNAMGESIRQLHSDINVSTGLLLQMRNEQKAIGGKLAFLNDTIEQVQTSAEKLKLTIDRTSFFVAKLDLLFRICPYLVFIYLISVFHKKAAAVASFSLGLIYIAVSSKQTILAKLGQLKSFSIPTLPAISPFIVYTILLCILAGYLLTVMICRLVLFKKQGRVIPRIEMPSPTLQSPSKLTEAYV